MSNEIKIITNVSLDAYKKKYIRRKERLLKFTKKEVEEFDRVNKPSTKNILLSGRKWCLIGNTYYQLPRPLGLVWFRNLNAGIQAATCVLGAGVVATAVTVPLVMMNRNNVVEEKQLIIEGDTNEIDLEKGETITLTISDKSTVKTSNIEWKSSDDNIAMVEKIDNGCNVIPKGEGEVVITATVNSNSNEKIVGTWPLTVITKSSKTESDIGTFTNFVSAGTKEMEAYIEQEGLIGTEGIYPFSYWTIYGTKKYNKSKIVVDSQFGISYNLYHASGSDLIGCGYYKAIEQYIKIIIEYFQSIKKMPGQCKYYTLSSGKLMQMEYVSKIDESKLFSITFEKNGFVKELFSSIDIDGGLLASEFSYLKINKGNIKFSVNI